MSETQDRSRTLDPAIARLIADATGALPRFGVTSRPNPPPELPLPAAANRQQRRRQAKFRQPPAAAPGAQDPVLSAAIVHHRAGRLRQAEAHYRRVLERDPDDPVPSYFLAVVLRASDPAVLASPRRIARAAPDEAENLNDQGNELVEQGRPAEALALFRRAIALEPGLAAAHCGMGNALLDQDRTAEAVECYRQAIALQPELAGPHCGLGNALKRLHRLDDAVECYQRALALRWDLMAAHNNLGNARRRQGRLTEAIACYRRALALSPGFVAAHNSLGNIYADQNRLAEAIACYERVVQLVPHSAEAHNNLGNALKARGQWKAAAASYRRALKERPRLAATHNNLATVFHALGHTEEAITWYRQAVALQPDFAEAHSNLGNVLKEQGKVAEAAACYQRAVALAPKLAAAHNNLGNAFKDQGQHAEAIACFRQAIALQPDLLVALSNVLMTMQYDPQTTPDQLFRAHRDAAARFGQPSGMPHPNRRDPARRIRVGYLSPNLGQHPIGFFLAPVLPAHDRGQVEVVCYSDRHSPDHMTPRLQAASDVWRETSALSDDELERQIRADGIDILVDLAGHTAENRLALFARKPAPLQVTWAGYVGTTGLPAIDYLISDERQTPTGTDHLYVEQVIRLPDCYVCFAPPVEAPSVATLPARQRGFVTFGCFNNLTKITPAVLSLWGRLLDRLPESRLMLKTQALDDAMVRERYSGLAAAAGIAPARIDLVGRSPHREFLAAYGGIDIALDPFPYSGGLTTLESLWMGVPVVTLGGDRFASRHSCSHLTAAGLTALIAGGPDDYVEIANQLARDLPRLERLRGELRAHMAASPLCDGRRFAANLDAAYRRIWQRWCSRAANADQLDIDGRAPGP